jgi:hypothetical protein
VPEQSAIAKQPGFANYKTFKADRCISALVHCDRNPTHLVALAALLVRRIGRLC